MCQGVYNRLVDIYAFPLVKLRALQFDVYLSVC